MFQQKPCLITGILVQWDQDLREDVKQMLVVSKFDVFWRQHSFVDIFDGPIHQELNNGRLAMLAFSGLENENGDPMHPPPPHPHPLKLGTF